MTMQPLFAFAATGGAGLLYFFYRLFASRDKTDVNGKVVLITGSGSGLGKAIAKVFFSHGCKIILSGRSMEELEGVKEELSTGMPESQSRIAMIQLDLCELTKMEEKAKEAEDCFGQVDILINNAGVSFRGCIEDTDIDVHMKIMTVNYFGQIALTKAILPYLQKAKEGHIVTIGTIQGRVSQAYRSAYAASKHALQAYFDCLRAEMCYCNIHVCMVNPSYIRTDLSRNALRGDGSEYGGLDKTTAEGMPPEEVAEIILKAVKSHQKEVFPAKLIYRLAIVIRAVFPNLMFWILKTRAVKQRNHYVKNR